MKRKASRPAPYEVPAKLSKRTTSTTVSRKLSTLKRTSTTARAPMLPPRFPSVKSRTPSVPRSASLPKPAWPSLVPTSRGSRDADPPTSSAGGMAEISEEPSSPVPGLRRLSTLPLEEEKLSREGSGALNKTGSKTMSKTGSKTMSKTGSSSLSKKGSSLSGMAAVATLEKRGSVVTLDTSGTVTTITRLASGSSTGETTGLSIAPPAIRKELSKAASTASSKSSLSKKVSSIRVYGVDAPEDPPASLSRSGSTASKGGSIRKEASLVPPPSVPLPPGGLIEIVFSFDTTGSMSTCIDEVRGRVGDMIQRLQADIPGIRIAVIAHGDYCDAETFYVIKWIDFGASVPELCNFVETISGTGGGDFDECYELVMARAQTELSWTPGSQRSLVMIGDATPHPPSYYSDREEKLDWREETAKLAAMGVRIYGVQAMNNPSSTSFYQTIAKDTRGHHLRLDQFNNIFDMLMVLCYNEKGAEFVQAYEDEVRTREGAAGLHKDLEGLFSAIRGGKPSEAATKVLKKGAAKVKKITSTKKTPAPKGKAKTPVAKGKPKAGAKAGAKPTAKKGAKATAKKGAKATAKKGTKATAKKGTKATAKRGTKATAKKGAKAAANKAKGKGVKTVKGRKPAKTAVKKKTKTTKTQRSKPVPGVQRKFREAVKDEELGQGSCMRHVEWTEWVKAIVLNKPRGTGGPSFKDRVLPNTGMLRKGLRNLNILWNNNDNAPAVYEVAVQLKPKKRYVVFFKACKKWRRGVKWDTVLLNTPTLNMEVNKVVMAGGQIWLRRGNLKTAEQVVEVERHVRKLYDYAWNRRKAARGKEYRVRRVKKCNTLISGHSAAKGVDLSSIFYGGNCMLLCK